MNFPQSFDAGPAVVVDDDVVAVVAAAGIVYLATFKTNKNQTNR